MNCTNDKRERSNGPSHTVKDLRALSHCLAGSDDRELIQHAADMIEVLSKSPHSSDAATCDLKATGALWLAMWFHDTYESLAPLYGYETKPETRLFDAHSPNGKLMIAVMEKLKEQSRCAQSASRPIAADAAEVLRAIDNGALGSHVLTEREMNTLRQALREASERQR